ncbi:putative membrane protein [Smittium mucronatum]|uniref:Putative membrane protein n=1 Tax=Smittium mucronatum TaxID=133383 RepID=A0A1R0H5E2_9FUNG|nr:putative membrane protein [Smittium mucronatum]
MVIISILILIFCFLRTKNKYFYSPRSFSRNKDSNPGILPKSFFGWVSPLFRHTTTELVRYCGPDGCMIHYVVKQNCIIFIIFSVFACAILIPINVTSGGGLQGLDALSMSNVTTNPDRLWAHLSVTIFFSVIVVVANYAAASKAVTLRQKYLNSFNYLQTQRSVTVLVSGIPTEKNNVEDIRAEMGDRLPSNVEIYPIKDPKILTKPLSERNKYHLSLESELSRLATLEKKRQILIEKNKKPKDKPIERKQKKLGFLGLFGEKVDFIENATSKIVENNTLISEKSSEYSEQPPTYSAFLVFRNINQAHSFANRYGPKTKTTQKIGGFATPIYTEVDPQGVIWKNLSVSQSNQHSRKIVSYIVSLAIILLWIIPTSFVSIIANFDTLAKYSMFSWINNLPNSVKGILQGLIPAIALVILNMIVPIFFRMLIKFEKGPLSRSIELLLIDRYFAFNIINTLIIYLISGTIFSSIKEFIDDPSTVVQQMASNVPKNSTFYITYVLLLGLSSSSGDIAMLVGFVIRTILRKFFKQTPREVFNKKLPQQLSVGTAIPVLSFVFLLGIVFCTIAPLMTVASLIFFSSYLIVHRYNLVFVYDPLTFNYEGRLSVKLLSHRWVSLYMLQSILLLLLAINVKNTDGKGGYIARLVLISLSIFFTAISHIYMKYFMYPRILYIDSSLPGRITNSKISKWASAIRGAFSSNYKPNEKSSPLLPNHRDKRRSSNWRVSETVSGTESQSEKSINNETQGPSSICNLGYEKISSPTLSSNFMPPEFSDSGFTTVWVPHIDSVAVKTVYEETQELLKEKGNVIDSDNHFDNKGLLHVTTDTLPDHI